MIIRDTAISSITSRYLPQIISSILTDVISNLSYSLIPALTAILIDRVLGRGDLSIASISVIYAVLLSCYLAFGYLSQVIAWNYIVGFERDAKNAYFSSVIRERKVEESGAILSQLTNNVTKIEQDFLTPCVAIIKDCAALLLYATILYLVSTPLITATLLLSSICLLFLPRLVRATLSEKASAYFGILSEYTARAEELLRARSYIPSQCRYAIVDEHGTKSHKVANSRRRWGIVKATSDLLAGSATEILLLIAFILAGYSAVQGDISIGVVAATIGYSQAFLSPLEDILYCFNAINSTAAIRRHFNAVVSSGRDKISLVSKPSAAISNVRATKIPSRPDQVPNWIDYPRVTFELSLGEKLYFRGASGTGKSTIMRAVSFGVNIDGASVSCEGALIDYDNGWNPFAYVGTMSPVFHASFVDNVTLFGAFIWDEAKLNALSGDTGLLERLRDRDDMAEASGGEKQFMLLARAILHQPAFYVLDEPTSAMDSATQECVLKYFSSIPEGVILSTHQENAIPDVAKWKVLDLNALN